MREESPRIPMPIPAPNDYNLEDPAVARWINEGGSVIPPYRTESDALGEVQIPAEQLWGAQTQRSLVHFPIGGTRFQWGRPVIRALGILKKCAASANQELQMLPESKAELIVAAAQEVIDGRWDAQFPLGAFQSGSGTQTNMNANEVIANRANQLAGGQLGVYEPIHPNDHVNLGQSSNDAFPTVMHLATVEAYEVQLKGALKSLCQTLTEKALAFQDIVMIGRTHLQDATPVTLGQVISGWLAQLEQAEADIERALQGLFPLAIGGTAVGTGVNTHFRFGELVALRIAEQTEKPFTSARNKFAALSAHDALVTFSASLRTLACAVMKIANDVRWYSSGPRAGLGELGIPENEPGSSIMPGKVNPTQCEMLTMVAVHVFGNDHAVAFAGSQGNFQLNVYKPILLHNVLESIQLLGEGCHSFDVRCVRGLVPNERRIQEHLESSLMLVTALSPRLGYEKAASIARLAHREGLSLKEAALRLALVTPEQYDQWVRPKDMLHPKGLP